MLIDILSKREYLYRRYFKEKLNSSLVPNFLTVSPNNSILKDVRSNYLFIDPTTYSSEVTRELLYQSSDFLRYSFLVDFMKLINNLNYNFPINFNSINNYFIYLTGLNYNTTLGNNKDLFKSQYRPM
jgi:hypothetical protein